MSEAKPPARTYNQIQIPRKYTRADGASASISPGVTLGKPTAIQPGSTTGSPR